MSYSEELKNKVNAAQAAAMYRWAVELMNGGVIDNAVSDELVRRLHESENYVVSLEKKTSS